MRTAPIALRNKLFQRLASKPMLKLSILWANQFVFTYWSSDKLISVSPVTLSTREDNTGTTGSCTVSLDDRDDSIRQQMNSLQLEDASIKLELTFADTPNDYVVLIIGRATDIMWSDEERSVSFTIESEVYSREMGFAPNTSDYPALNPDATQIPWPIVFGTPTHVPAVHVKHRTEGYLQSYTWLTSEVFKAPGAKTVTSFTIPTGIDGTTQISEVIAASADTPPGVLPITLTNECDVNSYEVDESEEILTTGNQVAGYIFIRNGEMFPQNTELKIAIDGIIFRGKFDDNVFSCFEANCAKYNSIIFAPRDPDDPDTTNAHVAWIRSSANLVNCLCYIASNEANNSDLYNRCIKQEQTDWGTKCWFEARFQNHNGHYFLPDESRYIKTVYPIEPCGLLDNVSGDFSVHLDDLIWGVGKRSDYFSTPLLRRLDAIKKKNHFWSASEETIVTLWTEDNPDPEIFVCNLLPSQNIRAVYAYRQVGKFKIFAPVPSEYYTKVLNYNALGKNTTALLLNKLLSDYAGQGWADDLYVTMTSTVGPNIADIIRWILINYTGVVIDESSFSTVRSYTASYPVNFALLEQENALRICQRLAWESKCALSIVNNVAILYYVPAIPFPVITLDETSIDDKSLVLQYTQVAEIVTKLTLNWQDSYKPRKERVYLDSKRHRRDDNHHISIGRQNINLYGVIEQSKQVISYNVEEYVDKTGNFWLNRISNSWTKVSVKTYLQGVLPLPFDGVFLRLTDSETQYHTFAVVLNTSFDWNTKTTRLDLLLPVRQGTNTVDPDFWTSVDVIPNVTNPSFKYKELAYTKADITEVSPNILNLTPRLPGVITKTYAPTSNNDPTDYIAADAVTVSITKNGEAFQSEVQGNSPGQPGLTVFPGERIIGKQRPDGSFDIESSIEDKIVKITGVNAGLGKGYYEGTLYSAGEVFKFLGKNPTVSLALNDVPLQGQKVIVMNTGETSSTAWTKAVINQFSLWLPVKHVDRYQNGAIVVQVFLEAQVIRNIRYNNTTDFLQGSYMINPGNDTTNWFDIVAFANCNS